MLHNTYRAMTTLMHQQFSNSCRREGSSGTCASSYWHYL